MLGLAAVEGDIVLGQIEDLRDIVGRQRLDPQKMRVRKRHAALLPVSPVL
jgi:hypothetical protein